MASCDVRAYACLARVNLSTSTANREVILSAGAINSPQILQLSGIGPADLLRSQGIEVIRDAPVGENLQDHLQIRAVFKVNGTQTLNTLANSPVWQTENRC